MKSRRRPTALTRSLWAWAAYWRGGASYSKQIDSARDVMHESPRLCDGQTADDCAAIAESLALSEESRPE